MKKFCMEKILPRELLHEIQKYVQGKSVYIPKQKENRKKWGDITQGKAMTSRRNDEIRSAYRGGAKVSELCECYCLSESSIKKIIYAKK
ncbi:MAG: CD3324 family protein [Defluviitaleaceae bacterium]|nr:CD3324 family protein [Defluviitaleaceae bacterium]